MFADSNRARIIYGPESHFGVRPPNPQLKTLRFTTSDLAPTKQTAISAELRSDRMVADMAEVGAASGGTTGLELSLGGTFDDLIEAALCGTWSTLGDATGTYNISSGTKALTASTGNPFANIQVGQWVYVKGFANAAEQRVASGHRQARQQHAGLRQRHDPGHRDRQRRRARGRPHGPQRHALPLLAGRDRLPRRRPVHADWRDAASAPSRSTRPRARSSPDRSGGPARRRPGTWRRSRRTSAPPSPTRPRPAW
jgi:hypothetical protein